MRAMPLKRVLIANRSEIARRIAKTLTKMGIETVVPLPLGHCPDYLAPYLTIKAPIADDGVKSYLDGDLLIQLALEHQCDAIHPGFGFLSENAFFAEQVEKAGLTFIGPRPEVIRKLGSKDQARELADHEGVPCPPGLADLDMENLPSCVTRIKDFGHTYGYPLLIKAAHGGGGKGMRIVYRDSDLLSELEQAKSEAESAFGHGQLLVEIYVKEPRHVEVQVLGDLQGTIKVIGDRDCSIQRRHQKIIEEAPAMGLWDETRAGLYEAAQKLCHATGYTQAGTVEFLVDWSEPDKKQPFYFLEMNTRLQVEHPVTEEVFGVDLVEWQMRIARGESLQPLALTPKGHAIEARLYAEDPSKNFLPSAGPVEAFVPYEGLGIRWEIGLDLEETISAHFDPMVAKVIAHGHTRAEAAQRLAQALRQTFLINRANNRSLLVEILGSPEFLRQIPTTKYLADHLATHLASLAKQEDAAKLQEQDLFANLDNWHSPSATTQPQVAALFRRIYGPPGPAPRGLTPLTPRLTKGELGGCSYLVKEAPEGRRYALLWQSLTLTKTIKTCARASGASSSAAQQITAPVPGKIISIKSSTGAEVQENQVVVILESMKMQFEVKAQKTGILDKVCVTLGQQVEADAVLAVWKKT